MKEKHYCYNTGPIEEVWGRIHVPLAKKCTLKCTYCSYLRDGNITDDNWRPGSSSGIVEGKETIYAYLKQAVNQYRNVKIIGVSGPGDPLENIIQVRELIAVMKEYYPDYYLCICTNGSIWNTDVQWLLKQPLLRYITLTINTIDMEKYPVLYQRYRDLAVHRDMWENQLRIIRECTANGIKVKINTVYVPGTNDTEITEMYRRLREEGVSCFNLMPQIDPESGRNKHLPECEKLQATLAAQGFDMMTKCKHCRADHCECGKKAN